MRARFLETHKLIVAAVPVNITGVGFDGVWASMREWNRAAIILPAGAWAGGTSAIIVEQATDFAAGGAKSLDIDWQQYVSLTSDVPSALNAVTSATFTVGTANRCYVIDLWSDMLDVTNGFHTFRVRAATPGANADLLAALYVMWDGRFQGDEHRTAIA